MPIKKNIKGAALKAFPRLALKLFSVRSRRLIELQVRALGLDKVARQISGRREAPSLVRLLACDSTVALKQWAERNAASAFIIPTEIFSARRVRWIFHRELSGRSVRIEIPSFEQPGYTHGEWWKTEQGVIAFQNEVLKYIYYRLKY